MSRVEPGAFGSGEARDSGVGDLVEQGIDFHHIGGRHPGSDGAGGGGGGDGACDRLGGESGNGITFADGRLDPTVALGVRGVGHQRSSGVPRNCSTHR